MLLFSNPSRILRNRQEMLVLPSMIVATKRSAA
jgi:hypothetical protein